MIRRILPAAALAIILVGSLSLAGGGQAASKDQGKGGNPIVVTTAQVRQVALPLEIRTIGTVQPLATVALKARIDGEIVKVHFNDGDYVRAGAPLFSIDNRLQAAAVAQAEAAVARDKASLANAKRELDRYAPLANQNVVSRQKLDQTRNDVEVATANLKVSEAAAANARVLMAYTEIRSPVDGRAGAIALPRGNMVKANDTNPLVVINQMHPIQVAFSIPQNALPQIRAGQSAAPLTVAAVVPGDPAGPAKGKLAFIDNNVDVNTGTILLKASFDNKDDRLWPGQSVQVALTLRSEQVLALPEPAVQNGQNGPYVFVVKPDSTVEARPVTIARSQDGTAVVEAGLEDGETVVTDGQFRLTPGIKVEPKAADPKTLPTGAVAKSDKQANAAQPSGAVR